MEADLIRGATVSIKAYIKITHHRNFTTGRRNNGGKDGTET